MLKVETEYLDNRQAKLTVSVDDDRLQKALRGAASRISARINIPGFRKGKAPFAVVTRFVGDDVIYDEALEPLGQAVYEEALEESSLQPYAPGILEEVSRQPLVLSFTVPLIPEIDLGSYRDLRVPLEPTKVTEADIDHAIDHLMDDQATLEHVDRPVMWEDVAILDISGVFVGDPGPSKASASTEGGLEDSRSATSEFLDRKAVRVLIGKKATYPVPGFAEQIIGMNAEETRSFDVAISRKSKDVADELRGRTIHFEVKCADVLKRDLPQLDDDFAQSLGEYTDLADLRTKLREQLEIEAERTSKNEYTSKIFDELVNKGIVKVSYPPVIVDQQIDEMIEDFERQLKRQGMNLEDYLNLNSLTKDDLRAEFRDSADQQVRRGLILGEVCEQEHLTVTDEEIEDEIKTQLLSFGTQAALARQLYSSPDIRRSLANHRLTDKGLERLMQIAKGEAPPLDAEAPAGDKPASPAKKKRASTAKPKKSSVKKAEPATK